MKLFLSLTIWLGFLTCSQHAYAGEPTDQMKGSIDAVIKILKNKELKAPEKTSERRAAIRKIIDSRFDFRKISKRALAINWRKRTPEERKEFVSLFSDLLEANYIKKIEKYDNEKILYVGESVDDGYAKVKTKVITKRNEEIPIDYMLIKEGTKWMVYDVIIEGVSLVENYREQFQQIIDSSSYAELVRKLRQKELKRGDKL
jgi:phospholipid transport system substrate-binding protein